jgi:hypothetical protein
MINKSDALEMVRAPKKNVYMFQSNETKKRNLFINSYIERNFGPGKFYSKLKTYGCGEFSIDE